MFTAAHGFAVELFLNAFGLCFCGWVFHKSWGFRNEVLKRRVKRKGSVSNSVSSNRDNSHFLIHLTVFENGVYLMIVVFSSMASSDYFRRALRDKDVKPYYIPRYTFLWLSNVLMFVLISVGMSIITLVASERLHSTFHHSQYRVSDRTTNIVRWLIMLVLILNVPSLVAYAFLGYGKVSLTLYMVFRPLTMLIFIPLNVWVIRSFIQKSMAIVKSLDVVSPVKVNRASSVSQSDEDYGASQSDIITPTGNSPTNSATNTHSGAKLAHTALRVTLACSLPLITTSLTLLFGVFAIPSGSLPLTFLARYAYLFDWCFNTFGILCTFKGAKPYYDLVFGWLHQWLFDRLFNGSN